MGAEAAKTMAGNPERALRAGLGRLRRWVRLLLALRFAALAVGPVALAAAVVVAVARLTDRWYPPWAPEAALGMAILAAAVAAVTWRLPDRLLASSADRRLALRDRLATSLFLSGRADRTGLEQAQVDDSLQRLAHLSPRSTFRLRGYRSTKLAAGGVLAMLGAQFLPLPPLLTSVDQQREREALRQEGKALEPLAKQLDARAKETGSTETQELARRLQKLSQQLERGRIDRKTAVLSLRELEQNLQTQAERQATPEPKLAKQAAEGLAKSGQEGLSKRSQDLAALAAKKGDEAARKRLEELAKQAQAATTPEAQKKLAEQLKQEAQKLGVSGAGMELNSALSQALATGDYDAAAASLAEAQKALEAGQMSPEELKQLSQELSQAAQNLTPEQLKDLQQSLGAACKCAGKGDAKGAAACLAKAGQACQCAGLKSALKGAGQCCGQCAGGMCNGQGQSSTAGQGSGLGIGPGDSHGHLSPNDPAASLYAPRSLDVKPGMAAVAGQIKPGAGPMPSVEERGAPDSVSPGKVPYYEVMGDYSRSAEQALSREEVPPGDRPLVRRYFQALQGGTAPAADSTAPAKEPSR